MPPEKLYEYAIIRLVPKVERGEFLNVGVLLYCRDAAFLDLVYHVDPQRIQAFSPGGVDTVDLAAYLEAHRNICKGTSKSPIASLPIQERFRWLAATRSTIVQTSKVHLGFSLDPKETLSCLFEQQVL